MLYESIYLKFKSRQNESMVIEIRTIFTQGVYSGEMHIDGGGWEFSGARNIPYVDLDDDYTGINM